MVSNNSVEKFLIHYLVVTFRCCNNIMC